MEADETAVVAGRGKPRNLRGLSRVTAMWDGRPRAPRRAWRSSHRS